jgi:hypothetical protein
MSLELEAGAPIPDHEQKRLAFGCVKDAWAEGVLIGLDGDCLAQACLFAAIAELVSTYGEEATAQYAENLGARIRAGEFSLDRARQ